jgi:hypothetical protein
MHRQILGAPPGQQVDHINGDTLDNRRVNLRLATHGQNQHNRGKYRNNKSGYKGVSWDKAAGKWRAQIKFNNKKYNLGRYHDPIEAALAYDAAAIRLHGAFARLNFPATTNNNQLTTEKTYDN